ncbi:MAG: tetratricopeptide repeat protein, partial [Rhizomicrobium sp.]
ADRVGSVDSKRMLAEQYAQRGQYGEAVALYKDVAQGQFADDPVLLMGLARAQFLGGDGRGAQVTLEHLFAANPKFISEQAHMIYARALELQGMDADAAQEYGRLVPYFAGEEARARYAAILARLGRTEEARAVNSQIVKNLTGAPRRYRSQQRQWGDMAKAALR